MNNQWWTTAWTQWWTIAWTLHDEQFHDEQFNNEQQNNPMMMNNTNMSNSKSGAENTTMPNLQTTPHSLVWWQQQQQQTMYMFNNNNTSCSIHDSGCLDNEQWILRVWTAHLRWTACPRCTYIKYQDNTSSSSTVTFSCLHLRLPLRSYTRIKYRNQTHRNWKFSNQVDVRGPSIPLIPHPNPMSVTWLIFYKRILIHTEIFILDVFQTERSHRSHRTARLQPLGFLGGNRLISTPWTDQRGQLHGAKSLAWFEISLQSWPSRHVDFSELDGSFVLYGDA